MQGNSPEITSAASQQPVLESPKTLIADGFPTKPAFTWAKAFTFSVLILTTGALLGLHLFVRNAQELLKPALTGEATQGLFSSYVVGLQGRNHLQIAELKTTEEFGISSEKTLLRIFPGGTVEVSAKVPCDIVYHVALKDAEWKFHVRDNGRRLIVIAPEIGFNRPAIDLARYELRVDKSSMIRDSDEVKALLQSQIPTYLEEVGKKNIDSIRDTARLSIKDFIENWLLNTLKGKDLAQPVVDRVYFKDEHALYSPLLLLNPDSAASERHN